MRWPFSKLFAGGKPEGKNEYDNLARLFEDEAFQNSRIPQASRARVAAGDSIDEIPGSFGAFGLTLTNPIPVNGMPGEIVYLSSLRHGGKTKVLFHRIGSLNEVDIYETVTADGSAWGLLYFHMYHPRKSRKSPRGYSIVPGDRAGYGIYGVNHLVPNFPDGLSKAVSDFSLRLLGSPMVPADLQRAEQTAHFVRPKAHLRMRDDIEVQWVRRPGTYADVAREIIASVVQEVDKLFPAFEQDVRRFWANRNLLHGNRLAVCEHPSVLKIALTACVAAAWYFSVLASLGKRDAAMLIHELDQTFNHAVREADRVVFDETFASARQAAVRSIESSAAATGTPMLAIGIADALMSVLELRTDASAPIDVKLTEEFVLQFYQLFDLRSAELTELKTKYVMVEDEAAGRPS
jgi:hypothetical protein